MSDRLLRIAAVWPAIAIGLALSASFIWLATPALAQQGPPPDKSGGDENEPRLCSPLPGPATVTVTAGDGEFTVSWSTVSNSFGGEIVYQVDYRQGSSGNWSHIFVSQVTSTTKTGLTNGSLYEVKVRATVFVQTAECEGYWSDVKTVTPQGSVTPPPTTPPPTTPTPTATPNLPDPPTSLVVTRDANSVLTVSVGYTQSSGSVHNYQIELHSAATENGTYALQATSNDSTASPAVFQYQLTDSWFKARGRNCSAAERTDCGTWSDWSAAIAPPTYLFLTNIRSSIEATESVSVSGWAFNLDPLSRYSNRVTTSGGDIGFNSDCTDNQEDITVPAGSSHYNFNVVPSLYACDAGDGTVNAVLLSGASTVATATPEDIAVTPPSMIAVDPQNPYAGQTVTMTATAPTSRGAVTSYRWQEFSAGQWSDLISATSSQSVPSDASGKRVFKVEATYTSGKKEDSAWVLIDWKPITVAISASPDNPESGDAAKKVVTLTAKADAPSGVTYQWQQGSGNTWTNLDAATSTTKKVSFSTRGTRKFKILVQHTTASSAESEAIYVTWDEWAIMGDLVTALRTAVTGDATFVSAQTALVTCINTTTPVPTTLYTSFDDILDGYTGETKSKMDAGGDCSSKATMMFGKNRDLHLTKLATLKSGSSTNALQYAALLETPQGSQFGANVGDSDTLKRLAHLGATVGVPGTLVEPIYYEPTPGRRAPRPPLSVVQGSGLDCLPSGVDGARLTLSNKMLVLNCLVFDTPHSFWVRGDASSREAKQLKREIDSPTGRYAWLKRGDWMCTKSPQGPVPSCLKHDVAYGGLQKFAGGDAVALLGNDPNGDELDEAWNPRNKALADEKLRADIRRHGCQDQPSNIFYAIFCRLPKASLANGYHEGIQEFNNKGWPITPADVSDFTANYKFKVCSQPVVPTVSGLIASKSGYTITSSWDFVPGCVPIALEDVKFGVNWNFDGYTEGLTILTDPNSCATNGDRLTCSYVFNFMPPGTVITAVSIFVIPNEREFAFGAYDYGGIDNRGRRYTVNVGPFEF